MAIAQQAVPSRGFDINQPLTAVSAKLFKENGEVFVIRYLPRTPELVIGNLTVSEVATILASGLKLMAVQHVALPGWLPTAALGMEYGAFAARYATSIGILPGTTVWLDLESVSHAATSQLVIDYCKAWFVQVNAAGFAPGIYVGWETGLTSVSLHDDLPFESYWNAYNGPGVATRGCQIVQHPQQTLHSIVYDPNILQADHFGGLPYWMSLT